MSKSAFRVAALAAGGTLLLAASAQAVIINVQSATGNKDQTVTVGVNLSTEGAQVAGTQNDIGFAAPIGVAAKTNGRPDCTVNGDINKGGTSFAFQPSGCTAGTDCTGARALVLALDNVDPIADGSVLYACQVKIAADAAAGNYPLTNTNTGASDPDGVALTTTGTDGSVTVEGAVDTLISVGSAEGNAGQQVQFNVTLTTTQQVAGTQNDIAFDPLTPIGANTSNRPLCAVNPDISKGGTSFAFQPSGCAAGECTGVRALVLALDNVDPIPTGSVMYSCQVVIDGEATEGNYPLTCTNAGASDPAGVALQAQCSNGQISVVGEEETPTETPTNTPVVTPPPPASTATNTPVPTNTRKPTATGGGGNDDDGCAIVAPAQSSAAWMLLLPAAALLWLRRRSR
jgi:MYXO-CTERM domain-containing protein